MTKAKIAYPVEFAENAFGDSPVLADLLKKVTGKETPRILLVADGNVVQRTQGLGTRIGKYLQTHGISLAASPAVLSGGEKLKADGLHSAMTVISALLAANVGPDDCVVVIGGGSMIDVAGYAAAQVRGGLKTVRIPTTPASMIDGAFADFAAIDSKNVKDALRVKAQPDAVVIDCTFARTVLDAVWRSGIGEALRLGLVADAALVKAVAKASAAYQKRDYASLRDIVQASVATRIKKGSSTFALWSANRLESMSGYKLPHGYSVTIGMCIDLAYAVERGFMKADDRNFALEILRDCGTLDGLMHSRHLLGQTDAILKGLGEWNLRTAKGGVPMPGALGKMTEEPEPDAAIYRKIFAELLSIPAEA